MEQYQINMSQIAPTDEFHLPKITRRVQAQDFNRYGKFSHINLPFHTPIPEEIAHYIFGKDHEAIGSKAELKFLLHLHELVGDAKYEICTTCGSHIVML